MQLNPTQANTLSLFSGKPKSVSLLKTQDEGYFSDWAINPPATALTGPVSDVFTPAAAPPEFHMDGQIPG